MAKIAIMMSTYNGENYLREQLDSIISQTIISSVHLYIRDDSSCDSTCHIIEEYKGKMAITLLKGENIGPAKSFWYLFMNKDIQADYYAFCDQDDIWDNDKLEKGIKNLSEYMDGPALWCSNCRLINDKNEIVSGLMNKERPQFEISAQFVCGTTQGCAMVFNDELRKLVLAKDFSGNPMHDFVILTNAIIHGKVFYDHTPTFSYRVHSNNVIEKSGKSLCSRMRGTLNRWFSKNHKYELSRYAEEFLMKNHRLVSDEQRLFLTQFISSRSSIKSKLFLIKNARNKTENIAALRSYIVRVLLGIV